eukprot:3325034-Pleurochrysis_carterae.AAC.2
MLISQQSGVECTRDVGLYVASGYRFHIELPSSHGCIDMSPIQPKDREMCRREKFTTDVDAR